MILKISFLGVAEVILKCREMWLLGDLGICHRLEGEAIIPSDCVTSFRAEHGILGGVFPVEVVLSRQTQRPLGKGCYPMDLLMHMLDQRQLENAS